VANGQQDNSEPPHCIKAEMGLLGSMILVPDIAEEVLDTVSREKLAKRFFYEPRHLTVFEAMMVMRKEGLALDAIMLTQKLKEQGKLELIGGEAYIVDLINSSGSITNWRFYLSIMEEKFRRRQAHRKDGKGAK